MPEPVWELFAETVARIGRVSTCVEWDAEIPEWERLAGERARAKAETDRVLGAMSADADAEAGKGS